MSARNDGGPAFPLPINLSQDNTTGATISHESASQGATLRDFFAAKAPTPPEWFVNATAHNGRNPRKDDGEYSIAAHAAARAEWAFIYADAMLRVRGAR